MMVTLGLLLLYLWVEIKQRWEYKPLCAGRGSGWRHSVDTWSAYTVFQTASWTIISEWGIFIK